MRQEPFLILNTIAQAIYDKKGINTLVLDVTAISTITDYVVIAEGNVDRHVIAIAQGILAALKPLGVTAYSTEGMQNGDWVVLDFYIMMVHLFMPGMRERYQLEELWRAGKIVDLNIDISRGNCKTRFGIQIR
jgi:ribosome-associated protein